MVLPRIRVPIEADATEAVREVNRVGDSIDRLGNRVPRAANATRGLTRRLSGLSNVTPQTRARIQQVSFQLQDIVVQLQAGTSASQTFTQQVPQLAGAFGAVGAAIGVVASLAIPALFFAFRDLRGEARDTQEILEDIQKALNEYIETIDLADLRTGKLAQRFRGELTPSIIETNQVLEGVNFRNAQRELDAFAETLSDTFDANFLRGEAERIARFFDLENLFFAAGDAARETRAETRRLVNEFMNARRELEAAEGNVVAQLEAMRKLLAVTEEAAMIDGVINRQEDEQLKLMAQQVQQAELLVIALRQAAEIQSELRAPPRRTLTFGEDPVNLREVLFPDLSDRDRRSRQRRDPGRGRIESLIKSLQTEQETIERFRQESLELLQQANAEELAVIGGHEEAKFRIQKEYMDRLERLRQMERSATLTATAGLFSALGDAFAQGGSELFNISKGFAIAGALINTYEGITKALTLAPPLSYIEAARVAATGFAQVASIRNTRPGDSGGAAGGGGGTGGGGGGTPEAEPGRTFVNVNLVGEGPIGRGQIRNLIQLINEEVEDGAVLGGIRVSGA